MFYLVDRRLNPAGKSLPNRQRFLRRAKALVRDAVREDFKKREIRRLDNGGAVAIPLGDLHEPTFQRAARGGMREYVLTGNKEFVRGDEIPKRPAGGGGRPEASSSGEGEDAFLFTLSQDEYLGLFLDDLELPDLAKRHAMGVEQPEWRKAGFSLAGSPTNLSLPRTMRNSLARRTALRRPSRTEMEALERELSARREAGAEGQDEDELAARLARMRARSRRIPYIDPVDLRYRQFRTEMRPAAQAVMFSIMDVSGSMTEHLKDLAKRFFALLYVFLKRRYRNVEIVFIRHTHEAQEVDEQTFFYSSETGGTVVSTALREMLRVVESRYSPAEWNIYAAQASDGDNTSSDNEATVEMLRNRILPLCQFCAYLEVAGESMSEFVSRASDLWASYDAAFAAHPNFAMARVADRGDIYPIFRELFQPRSASEGLR
ncbi:MAG: YeaH/YhbH family protein [Variibacter sp.]|nr:YeaH/YhbH family protein [Variibacter sp.]